MRFGGDAVRVKANRPPVFSGPFAKQLYAFIAHKQALGYKYYTVAESLTMFDAYSESLGVDGSELTKGTVTAWVEKRPDEKPQTQCGRISSIREFAKYLNSLGVPAYIPPNGTGARVQKYTPYIFTHAEVSKIFAATDRQSVFPQYPHSHLTTPAIVRLLYGTGIRVSEALALRIKDVNLEDGHIKVIDSKFGKDRLVPLSVSLTEYLRGYTENVKPTTVFFPNRDGGQLTANGMYARFRRILWDSGISHGGRGSGPRLHDLRHTFSAHTIAHMVAQGLDLYVALPILAAYLGHEKISTTNQYVRLTAEVFPEVISIMEQKTGFVFPVIGGRDEE
jgi:integrase